MKLPLLATALCMAYVFTASVWIMVPLVAVFGVLIWRAITPEPEPLAPYRMPYDEGGEPNTYRWDGHG